MALAFVIFFAVTMCTLALVSLGIGVALGVRRRSRIPGGLVGLRLSFDWRSRARDPLSWLLLICLLSLLLPWFTGSVGGIGLSRTGLGLPYVSWLLVTPVLVAAVTTLVLPRERHLGANVVVLISLFLAVVSGAVVLVALDVVDHLGSLASLGQQIAIDAGYGARLERFRLDVGLGLGPSLFLTSALAASFVAAFSFRRKDGVTVPQIPVEFGHPTPSDDNADELNPAAWPW